MRRTASPSPTPCWPWARARAMVSGLGLGMELEDAEDRAEDRILITDPMLATGARPLHQSSRAFGWAILAGVPNVTWQVKA